MEINTRLMMLGPVTLIEMLAGIYRRGHQCFAKYTCANPAYRAFRRSSASAVSVARATCARLRLLFDFEHSPGESSVLASTRACIPTYKAVPARKRIR